MEIEVDWDGSIPIYDKVEGKEAYITCEADVPAVLDAEPKRMLLPMGEITPARLRAIASTIELAESEGHKHGVLAVKNGQIGFGSAL
jgi:hypothetical protein